MLLMPNAINDLLPYAAGDIQDLHRKKYKDNLTETC